MSDDLRLRVAWKVDELADLLNQEPNWERRETLWSLAVDDLAGRMQTEVLDVSALARAFREVTDRFWRPDEFSVKAPEPARLRLVSEDEFEQMAYPGGRTA